MVTTTSGTASGTTPADDGSPSPATGERRLAVLLVIGGAIGLVASAVLLIERIRLAEDPTYVPSCSINPVLSCGSIMESAQAALLGFPNPVIGVAAFPAVLATGAALLAGARLARWYWLGLQAGVIAALVFVGWLITQSLYAIGALCPYCMVVWTVVWPLAWYVTLRNLGAGVLGEGPRHSPTTALLRAWHLPLLATGYLLVVALVALRFGSSLV